MEKETQSSKRCERFFVSGHLPITAGAYILCGCTDDFACNYDPEATTDNGTCEYETCAGCTDPSACDYDETATIEDGSCCYDNCVTITMNDRSVTDGRVLKSLSQIWTAT